MSLALKNDERRRISRIRRRAVVNYIINGQKKKGTILNFSEVGVFIQTDELCPIGSIVTIPMLGTKDKPVELRGRVMWVREPAETVVSVNDQSGFGLELFAAPPEYLRFVAKMRSELEKTQRMPEERFEVYHRVRYSSGTEFLTEYTENLSRGGMFLATNEDLEPGQIIQAQIEIDGMEEPIHVSGKVAYRLDSKQAKKQGRVAGFGIQFVDLSSDTKEKLNQYIRRLEVHRARPDRRFADDIPNEGSLSEFLVPEILLYYARLKKTGILELERKGTNKKVYLKKGQPVFVESNLRTETLGQFLVREGRMTQLDLEESLEELAQSELHHGEIMVKGGMIDHVTLATALVEHQEEKLFNTFAWFEGKFQFKETLQWPPYISILPLRTYEIIFRGISRWYDEALIQAWMGLNEQSAICRLRQPEAHISIPPLTHRILHNIQNPTTLQKLSSKLGVELHDIVPAAYALIIAGWAELTFTEKVDVSQPEQKPSRNSSSVPSLEIQRQLETWIEEDFRRLKDLNFYELLDVPSPFSEGSLKRTYEERVGKYKKFILSEIGNAQTRERLASILSWLALAYETLQDPAARRKYDEKIGRDEVRVPKEKHGVDRIRTAKNLLAAVRELDEGKIKSARSTLEKLVEKNPNDMTLKGYLGWTLFLSNQKENHRLALDSIQQAIVHDPSDATLRFYRAEILSFLGDWSSAARTYNHALRLHPRFDRALEGFERALKNVEAAMQATARSQTE